MAAARPPSKSPPSDQIGETQQSRRPRPDNLAARGRGSLVADDNADMRDYVRRILAPRYDVEVVANGADALPAVRRQLPDLSVVGCHDAGARWLSRCCGKFGADPGFGSLPVILLSARAGDEAKIEGLDAGADDYLTKPFSAQELLARVNTNITMTRLRREIAAELEMQKSAAASGAGYGSRCGVVYLRQRGGECHRQPPRGRDVANARNGQRSRYPVPAAQVPQHFRVFKDGAELAPDRFRLRSAAAGETVVNEELELHFIDGSMAFRVGAGGSAARPLRER